jgi:hypothetical protein
VSESLEEFARRTDLLHQQKADQVRYLAWYLHSHAEKDRVVTGDIRSCFNDLHLDPPNISHYLTYLSEGKGRSFIRDKRGFRLEGKCRAKLNDLLLEHQSTVLVRSLLTDLASKIPDQDERLFLEEALRCYAIKAFRATVVMAWNLAFAHFRRVICSDSNKTDAFNSAITRKYPKKLLAVKSPEDFDELKEFEAIEIAQSAKLITKNVAEIMKDKLRRRNMAAHPSSVDISQAQADDVVTDLVNNVILKLS